jgi:SHS2 domain-containing protein
MDRVALYGGRGEVCLLSRSGPLIPRASHQILDHTSEVVLQVSAPTMSGLLAEAGRGLACLMLRGRTQGDTGEWSDVSVRSHDRESLLVDWLNELLYLAESRSRVPVLFRIQSASDTHVEARIASVPVAFAPAFVKAATLHDLRIETEGDELRASVTLDV